MTEQLLDVIRTLIRQNGRITFSRFMAEAMFSPMGGYYSTAGRTVGRDYYTSPMAHPVFGALMSRQIEQFWRILDRPKTFHLVEVGSGRGDLAKAITGYVRSTSSEFSKALEYIGVDYDPAEYTDGEFASIKGQGLPLRGLVGCIVSNELIDSFPVHRFVIVKGRILEVYVALDQGQFIEVIDEPSSGLLEQRLLDLRLDLPDGFRGEINLQMNDWSDSVSNALDRGFVLTIDYGHLATDLYSEERSQGTLRCYYRHILLGNPYQHIGDQDLTSHVDFTSLMNLGSAKGMVPLGYTSQEEFLRRLGFSSFLLSLGRRQIRQSELDVNRMSMLDLVKPDGMGAFKVLCQSKGINPSLSLMGFNASDIQDKPWDHSGLLPECPVLSESRLNLLTARYPHTGWEWEELWPFGKGT